MSANEIVIVFECTHVAAIVCMLIICVLVCVPNGGPSVDLLPNL